MVALNEFLTIFGHRITGGSDFQWSCYGPNARYIDVGLDDVNTLGSVLFDTQTQVVYEATAFDTELDQAYRWSNPDTRAARIKEAGERGVDDSQAWDDVKYQDLDADNFLMQSRAIAAHYINNETNDELDSDELVELNLDQKTLLQLCVMAHEQDITLNQLVNKILRELVDRNG